MEDIGADEGRRSGRVETESREVKEPFRRSSKR
jgi:hypothetical protein